MNGAHPHLGDGFVHVSNLMKAAKRDSWSPAHYRVACERREEPTPQMLLGSLAHAITLGGVDVAVFPGAPNKKGVMNYTRQTNAYDDFEAANKGKLVVTIPEYERAQLCAEAVRRHPVAGPLITGSFEHTILWEYMGRACSSRLDIISPDGDVSDLKFCSSVEPTALQWACRSMFYHAQLSFYRRAAQSRGYAAKTMRIIAIETSPPFDVTVMPLTEHTLLEGEKLIRRWMERLLACEASDAWPGYVQSEVDWDVENDTGLIIDGESVEDAA